MIHRQSGRAVVQRAGALGCVRATALLVWLLGLMAVCVAFPVGAQGQTPTTPFPSPIIDPNSPLFTGNYQQYPQQYPQEQPPSARQQPRNRASLDRGSSLDGQDSMSRRRSERGVLGDESTRRRSRDTEAQSGQPATQGAQPAAEGAGPGQTAEVAAGAAESATKGSGARTVTGGGGGQGGGAGGGASFTRGTGAASASVKGGASAGGSTAPFDAYLLREVTYGEVPDDGAENKLTLTGPMTVAEFLETINIATSWNILVTEAAKEVNLQFWISEKTPKEALEVLKFNKIFYEFDPQTKYLLVMTAEEHLFRDFGKLETYEFQVKNADVSYIESFVSSFMSQHGRLVSDPRTGRFYVWDTPDNIKQIDKVVSELDVPLEKREWHVQYASLADVESVVSSMLSPNGTILTDARTGLLIVWDGPSTLEQVALAVSRLDVKVASRTFEIKHIDAENLIDSLEAMLSERGMIQVDPRYNALIVTDLPQNIERMAETIGFLDRPLETRTWVIRYADIDFIADQIELLIPSEMGDIIVNEDVHQITVTGLPDRLEKIDGLIKTWDIKRRQVYIEAFIVEVNDEVERHFNINWSYFNEIGNAPVVVTGGTGFDRENGPLNSESPVNIGQLPYATPLMGQLELDENGNIVRPKVTNIDGGDVIRSLQGTNLAVTLDYLDRKDKATILSSPRVTVQDGEEAIFENATRVPFVSSTTTFVGGGFVNNNNTNRVEFIDVGTILSVVPMITEDQNILLDIAAEDSTFVPRVILSNGQPSTVPEKTVRRAETQLRVHSGETVVLGGLRRDRASHNRTKTPILGDIPVIGRLFRYPDKQSSNNTLLIFITTTIVDEFSHPEARILTKAENEIANFRRAESKDLWGRIKDKVAHGNNEIAVSVGQNGDLYSEGEMVTLEDLRKVFFQDARGLKVKVVIRKHPRAPEAVSRDLAEMALEAGLSVVYDDSLTPFVESQRFVPAPPAENGGQASARSESSMHAGAASEHAAPKGRKMRKATGVSAAGPPGDVQAMPESAETPSPLEPAEAGDLSRTP